MSKKKLLFLVDQFTFLEVFSIPIVSALSKKQGYAVQLVEFGPNPRKAVQQVKAFGPDIIGYSICSTEAKRYFEINRLLKREHRFFALFGGPHPTFFPAMVDEPGVDAICRGEADLCFPEFLEHFGTDKVYEVNNFAFKVADRGRVENPLGDLLANLDDIPFPDRDLVYSQNTFLAQSPIKAFFAGRGCPYNCSYCFNHAFNSMYRGKGRILRHKSVSYLFDEIREVREKYPLTFIKFHDDIFGPDPAWLEEFAGRYPREIGLPFNCYVRPNMATEDYCRRLQQAGCYSVHMAIESGNEPLRNAILQRNLTNDQILAACEHLKQAGIKVLTLNMVGLPGETEKEIFETIELNRRAGISYADASIFQPYPGTRINDYCKEHGYLDKDFEAYESQYTASILNFEPEFKHRVFVLHKLFSILVDYPRLQSGLAPIYRAKWLSPVLNLVCKLFYGFQVHRKIFASSIPLLRRAQAALLVILAKSRGA